MCGIVGKLNFQKNPPIPEHTIRQMLAMVRHRGPDEFGIYLDDHIGIGSARLSIIDLSGGQQPITNEDNTLWIVFNGEIYNYLELRSNLEKKGHHFSTHSDTEVILHLYEDLGPGCLRYLNGQFAIAVWDNKEKTLFLARDRFGIRPLFYTITPSTLLFASEIKALFTDKSIKAEIDPRSICQIFTYWATLSPNTAFVGIKEIPPGHYLLVHNKDVRIEQYWNLEFPHNIYQNWSSFEGSTSDYLEEFKELLIDATKIRLRADVPVGAYLSGGLDSSVISAIIKNYTSSHLDTFSIAFSDPQFDESKYQFQMAQYLGTDHKSVKANDGDIGEVFPKVIWHVETPLTRAGPAPLYLLSKLVRNSNYKVVMTGEGADEFLAGYNIFKEMKIRRFWAKNPDSEFRPALLMRLYPYISDLRSGSGAFLTAFFRDGLTNIEEFDYSHTIRWKNTSRIKRFFSDDFQNRLLHLETKSGEILEYPKDFDDWDGLSRAQYLEATTFLSQYLLSSQGDRMSMANSIEGRYPFLDHRVVEFCNQLPPYLKLYGLNEKYLLKLLAKDWLPEEIWKRPKTPYRAPIRRSFINGSIDSYVYDMLSDDKLSEYGIFNNKATKQLVNKAERSRKFSETDEMALVGILSTQLVVDLFLRNFRLEPPLSDKENIKICVRGIRAHSFKGFD
jgi:asparagine synthase (glutamine-hydrolysing)